MAPGSRSRGGGPPALVTGAVALAGALSCWGLATLPLWLDESLSLGATSQLKATLRSTAGTMGLYYVLLDAWTAVVGTSPGAIRLLSVLFAVAVVPLVAVLARRCLRPVEAGIGVVACAAMPGLVRYAQEARSYALVMLIASLSWVCLVRAVTHDAHDDVGRSRRWWLALALLSGAGVLSHGLYALQLIAQVASLLLLPGRRRLLRTAGLACLPTLLTLAVLARYGAAEIAEWVPPLSLGQLSDLARDLLASPTAALIPLLVLVGLGAHALLTRPSTDPLQRWTTLVPVAWGLAPVALLGAISVVRPYGIGRYVIASVPALALLAAVGAVRIGRIVARPVAERAPRLAVVVPVVLLGALLAVGQVSVHQRTGEDWRGAARMVAEGITEDDALVFTLVRSPFEAAWNDLDVHPPSEQVTVIPTPRPLGPVRRINHAEPWTEAEPSLRDRRLLWVVHRTMTGAGDDHLDVFMDLATVEEGYEVERHATFDGGVHVIVMRPSG